MLTAEDRIVVYMRPGCHVCARVKAFLTEHGVPYEARDVDRDPLTPAELWDLFNRKAGRLRVPFTALNDGEDVVLGFDPQRLQGVFVQGELGGVQRSVAVSAPLVYDEFSGSEMASSLWKAAGRGRSSVAPATDSSVRVETGQGQLCLATTGESAAADGSGSSEILFVSTRRFATPPGSVVTFEVGMSVDGRTESVRGPGRRAADLSLHDLPTGMVLGFEVTADAIIAVHKRLLLTGVSTETEHFSHRVITDETTRPGQNHRYRITYRHDTSQAHWFVDDRCVYVAAAPMQIEGLSLGMGLIGDAEPGGAAAESWAATWSPWQVSAA